MAPGSAWMAVEPGVAAEDARRRARAELALRAGWTLRWDAERGEYMAAREVITARTLDGLLDAIDAS